MAARCEFWGCTAAATTTILTWDDGPGGRMQEVETGVCDPHAREITNARLERAQRHSGHRRYTR